MLTLGETQEQYANDDVGGQFTAEQSSGLRLLASGRDVGHDESNA